MTKRQLIEEIGTLNPTAKPEFLAHFEEGDLQQYLEHLHWVAAPSPRMSSRWLQRPEVPVVAPIRHVACEEVEHQPIEEARQYATAMAVAVAEADEPQESSPFAQSSDSSEESPSWLY